LNRIPATEVIHVAEKPAIRTLQFLVQIRGSKRRQPDIRLNVDERIGLLP
jgi:hypothetical protein